MAAQKQSPRPRHVPQRMCVACRRTDNKRQLVRLVRLADQSVVVDPSGKQAGRGAYLCAERPCWTNALKRGALERALRVELSAIDQQALQTIADQFPDADPAVEAAMN
ncbi:MULTISPECIES: RNase P modulator RnpM [Herpetosiphon]|uniref:YlxR domain-containing protein n=1 Tax=Herpetosiphon geysericola TaxID=70996 RepID=A0A0P6Z441_9CHLR|nr:MULTISPECIES: YlxR family protein [Herpetosiphon]KPL92016.1 hypothetical protein SE18_00235 [Herpetosiphon geysericola]MBM7844766.1 putative RNA-binding protein YlxR (DUF448 family) [Herpetosiphon giganteus]